MNYIHVHILISAYFCIILIALGILKITSEEVLSHLLWAARFERLPVVRAQVCNTLSLLNVKEDRIAKVLRDLLTMEEDEVVVRYA